MKSHYDDAATSSAVLQAKLADAGFTPEQLSTIRKLIAQSIEA